MINNAEVKGVISFTKKDREGLAGKPLAGATFTLYSDADCTNVLQEVTTGTDGVVTFSHRPAGTYYIKETKAPAGYSFEDSTVYKAVVSNGRPTITRVGDAAQASITNITNKFGAGLNVRKIADGDIATAASVSGAEFTLSKQNGTDEWAAAKTLTTNANGGLTFTGLDQGTYTLTESKSPAGYESTQGITLTFTVDTDEETGVTSFTLADGSVIQPSAESGFVAWADASTASNIAYTVTVRNVPLKSLPAAGGKGIYLQTAAGVALMCAAGAAWFVHRSGWHTGGGRRA